MPAFKLYPPAWLRHSVDTLMNLSFSVVILEPQQRVNRTNHYDRLTNHIMSVSILIIVERCFKYSNQITLIRRL